MTTPPERTGNYLLGHAGLITAQNAFLARGEQWSEGVSYGWQNLPEAMAHRPTHWMYVPYPPRKDK